MLKAELLKEGKNIYYTNKKEKNSNKPKRTISVSKAFDIVYGSNVRFKPLKKNLDLIIGLRNLNTHFFTEDYEEIYAPIFQANVLFYTDEIKRLHNCDLDEYISQKFLILRINSKSLTEDEIKIKYPPEVAKELINQKNNIQSLEESMSSTPFAISVVHKFCIVKSKDEAEMTMKFASDSDIPVRKVIEYKYPPKLYCLSYKQVIAKVNRRIKDENINFSYKTKSSEKKQFTTYSFRLLIDAYALKENRKYS